jgi:hypothetical protein
MPIYQNKTVTDSKVEVWNYAIFIGTAGATAAAITTNLGAGMVSGFAYVEESFTSQAGNAIDPIEGIARETATLDIELIEYDGSAFSVLTGGTMAGSSGSVSVGGLVTVKTARGIKLTNVRKLASGSNQTTTYVIERAYLQGGWSMAPKSDNDSDPVNVYSFSLICKPALTTAATAATIFTKTVA